MRWTGLLIAVFVLQGCQGVRGVEEQPESGRGGSAYPSSEADPYAGSEPRLGTIKLHAGFNPDPHTVTGTALGEVEASTLRKKCRGWISKKPDYLMESRTAFYQLHVLARSPEDIVLVVRGPDGRVKCNDNRKGTTHPMVKSTFPIGTTQVWVGVKSEGGKAPYRLGFSEVKWKPSVLAPL